MPKLVYSVGISLDGFVAMENGDFSCFIMQGPHVDDFVKSQANFGTIIMGRKTYDVGLKFGVSDPYPNHRTIVFSKTMTKAPAERIEIVSENVDGFVEALKKDSGKDIMFAGAGNMAASLFEQKMVDEVHIKLYPVFIGTGIPVIEGLAGAVDLIPISEKSYENGVKLLKYRVNNNEKEA